MGSFKKAAIKHPVHESPPVVEDIKPSTSRGRPRRVVYKEEPLEDEEDEVIVKTTRRGRIRESKILKKKFLEPLWQFWPLFGSFEKLLTIKPTLPLGETFYSNLSRTWILCTASCVKVLSAREHL